MTRDRSAPHTIIVTATTESLTLSQPGAWLVVIDDTRVSLDVVEIETAAIVALDGSVTAIATIGT